MAFGLGYAVVYGPYLEAYEELSAYLSGGSNIMYGTFHRLVWGMAVAWVVYACHNGYGGISRLFSISVNFKQVKSHWLTMTQCFSSTNENSVKLFRPFEIYANGKQTLP